MLSLGWLLQFFQLWIIFIEVDANKALQAISEANAAIKELTDANKQLAAEMEADTDVFFMKFLKDYKISQSESNILDTLSQIVWFALGMLILTGIALYIPAASEYLMKTKFVAKLFIVGVITVNGVLLNLLVAPKLVKISFGEESVDHPGELHHLRKMAFAFGGVSIVSWLSVFILGSLRSLPLSVGAILGIYVALVLAAVIGSQIFDHKVSQHKL